MLLPMHNARLTKVEGGGFSEDYARPVGTKTAKWTGSAEAYIKEEVLETVAAGRLDQVKRGVLFVPANLGIEIVTDDYVTYTERGQSFSRRVRDIRRDDFLGVLRLTLWEA